uniref:Uncharacterized protein n=1 Tax=viral metagenome TaxID=1070528 RepID=A0A6M3LGD9_9ZZZZ
MIKIIFNDVPVYLREMKCKVKDGRICPLCRKEILYDEDIIFIVNNYVLFPNTTIHKKCLEEYDNINDVISNLIVDYTIAKQQRDYNTCWFREED